MATAPYLSTTQITPLLLLLYTTPYLKLIFKSVSSTTDTKTIPRSPDVLRSPSNEIPQSLPILRVANTEQTTVKMSETFQDLKDIPQDFFKEGTQFINRCTKREFTLYIHLSCDNSVNGHGLGWSSMAIALWA
ncbi:hypothetical protein PMZ80_007489 [Knufia obscura]|uniref:Uncharacterized protein n=1 Tax=Knufia obscura TaxID=1635080 RepID=A0ABR0RHI2_9EURO|nr:hypothetical protein PMZ80_007489 [Knufia obscura]